MDVPGTGLVNNRDTTLLLPRTGTLCPCAITVKIKLDPGLIHKHNRHVLSTAVSWLLKEKSNCRQARNDWAVLSLSSVKSYYVLSIGTHWI